MTTPAKQLNEMIEHTTSNNETGKTRIRILRNDRLGGPPRLRVVRQNHGGSESIPALINAIKVSSNNRQITEILREFKDF